MHRREILNYIKKNYADHFEGRDLQREVDELTEMAENIASSVEQLYLEQTVDEEKMPLFDFEINLNDE